MQANEMLLSFALNMIAKATILLLLAAFVTVIFSRMSAATRHRVWSLAFIGLLALPLVNAVVPGWNWRIIPQAWIVEDANIADQSGAFSLEFTTPGTPDALKTSLAVNSQPPVTIPDAQARHGLDKPGNPMEAPVVASDAIASSNSSSIPTILLMVWGAGVLVVLLPLLVGLVMNLRFRRGELKVSNPGWLALLEKTRHHFGIKRPVLLLAGGLDQMPMTFGFLRPVVVLPASTDSWPTERRRIVLSHELAHVKRLDVPLQALARIACALYWFHPLVWWSLRRMRIERELACDDCVLSAGEKASNYATELLTIAREYQVRAPLASAALSMARPSQLEGRLLAVLDGTRSRTSLSLARSVWLSVAAIAIVFAFGLLRPAVQAQTPKDQKGERILHFPADRAVGTIYVRPRSDNYSAFDDSWKKVSEARGARRVPATFEVKLDVSQAASEDLSFLQNVAPDEMQFLNLRSTHLRDDGLKHIGRLTGLVILDLQQTRISDNEIHHLSNLVNLRSIELEAFGVNREGYGVGDKALKVLAELPVLERIALRLTKVTDLGVSELVKLKTLKSLDVSGTQVSDAGLVNLKRLPKLEYLQLGVYDEGANVTDAGLKEIGQIVTLRHLNLSGTKVTNDGLRQLANLKQLKSLSMDSTAITEAGLAHLEPLTGLEEVRMYPRQSHITDVGAEHLSKVKSLRTITGHSEVSEKGIKALATLPRLERFELYGPKVTDQATEHLGRMKSIKWISFQDCPLTDDGLAHLAGQEHLELLFLHRTHVTGEGLRHFTHTPSLYLVHIDFGTKRDVPEIVLDDVGALPGLRIFRMGGEAIQNHDLQFLVNLPRLEELDVECKVDDEGASYVGKLTALKSLDLGNTVMTDVGLQHLANLRNLEYLRMDDGKFTDKGIAYLARLRSLNVLYLGAPNVTDAGLKALAEQVPALQRAENYRLEKAVNLRADKPEQPKVENEVRNAEAAVKVAELDYQRIYEAYKRAPKSVQEVDLSEKWSAWQNALIALNKAKPKAAENTVELLPVVVGEFNQRIAIYPWFEIDQSHIRQPALPKERTPAPLTVDEIINTIQLWDRTKVLVDDATYDIYRKIGESKTLPSGSAIRFNDQWFVDEQDAKHEDRHWWIDLDVMTGPKAGYTLRIRDQKLDRRVALSPAPGYQWIQGPDPNLRSGGGSSSIAWFLDEDKTGALIVTISHSPSDRTRDLRVVAFDKDAKRYELTDVGGGAAGVVQLIRFRLDPKKVAKADVKFWGVEAKSK